MSLESGSIILYPSHNMWSRDGGVSGSYNDSSDTSITAPKLTALDGANSDEATYVDNRPVFGYSIRANGSDTWAGVRDSASVANTTLGQTSYRVFPTNTSGPGYHSGYKNVTRSSTGTPNGWIGWGPASHCIPPVTDDDGITSYSLRRYYIRVTRTQIDIPQFKAIADLSLHLTCFNDSGELSIDTNTAYEGLYAGGGMWRFGPINPISKFICVKVPMGHIPHNNQAAVLPFTDDIHASVSWSVEFDTDMSMSAYSKPFEVSASKTELVSSDNDLPDFEFKTIRLNQSATDDFNDNGELNLAIVDYSYDYLNVPPTSASGETHPITAEPTDTGSRFNCFWGRWLPLYFDESSAKYNGRYFGPFFSANNTKAPFAGKMEINSGKVIIGSPIHFGKHRNLFKSPVTDPIPTDYGGGLSTTPYTASRLDPDEYSAVRYGINYVSSSVYVKGYPITH